MEYKRKVCPICGSSEIKIIGTKNLGEDIIHEYKCLSCDEYFSDENFDKKVLDDNMSKTNMSFESARAVLNAKEIFKLDRKSVVEIFTDYGDGVGSFGTGIVIKPGLIITNSHVIHKPGLTVLNNSTYLAKWYKDNRINELKLVDYDDDLDIAILKYRGTRFTPISVSTDYVETGDRCYSIGNAKGQGLSILEGLVSDKKRIIKGRSYILVSTLVTTGNSGGPLLNEEGKLIGMVTMGRSDAVAMNYAIPVETIFKFLQKAKQ